jgi:hypothetical protein
MSKLSLEEGARIVRCLVDGSSVRASARIALVASDAVSKFLVDCGRVCSQYQ